MADNLQALRPKPGDTEKITMNLGYVDLGHIDLMVQEGFYSNRRDFIRTAIRNQLERHAEVVKQTAAPKSLELGLRHYRREDLEAGRPGRRFTSMCWGSPALLWMSARACSRHDCFGLRAGGASRQRGRQGRSGGPDR